MKDYYAIQKQNKKIKERDMNFIAWGIVIIVVLVVLYLVLGWSGAGACQDVIGGKCIP